LEPRNARRALLLACALVGPSAGAACAVGVDDAAVAGTGDPDARVGVDAPASHADSGPGTESGAQAEAGAESGTPDAGIASEAGADVVEAASMETGGPDAGSDTGGADTGVTCSAHGTTGVLATFALGGQPGNESTAPGSAVAGVSVRPLSRASAITPVMGSGSINGSNWSTAASADAARYYSLAVTPAPGCAVTLSQIAIDVRASSTGPASVDVATNADGFAAHSASVAGTGVTTVSLSATGSGPIEIRVYGYGASGSAGTLRIQNTMTVSGSID
jgi:hypothetical protein